MKKFDEAIALQQEFAKTSYEGFVAQITKLGEMYANVAKVAFKPVEGAIAKVKASAQLSFGFSGRWFIGLRRSDSAVNAGPGRFSGRAASRFSHELK